MGEVAARLGVTTATLTGAVDKLAHKGYVERQRKDADRRQVWIRLTTIGEQAVRLHRLFHARMARATLQGLTAQEEQALIAALTKLKQHFIAHEDGKDGGA
jgi:DNA-binding MarR family transcriptional regulator